MAQGNEEPRGIGVGPAITLTGLTLVAAGAVLSGLPRMGPATLIVAWFPTAASTPAACYGGSGWYDANGTLRRGPTSA